MMLMLFWMIISLFLSHVLCIILISSKPCQMTIIMERVKCYPPDKAHGFISLLQKIQKYYIGTSFKMKVPQPEISKSVSEESFQGGRRVTKLDPFKL